MGWPADVTPMLHTHMTHVLMAFASYDEYASPTWVDTICRLSLTVLRTVCGLFGGSPVPTSLPTSETPSYFPITEMELWILYGITGSMETVALFDERTMKRPSDTSEDDTKPDMQPANPLPKDTKESP